MILNWEKGKMMFGNSEDLYKNELYTFSNVVVPPIIERIANSAVTNNSVDLRDSLLRLKGSAKYSK